MRINNNIMAMNTHRQLGMAQGAGAKSMEKLSSGHRINRAGDDAAGLSISEKMRNQVRGLNRASANSQDGISLIQTAEGALDEVHSLLKRMRELTVQAGNEATLQEDDMDAIKDEFTELSKEIDGIAFKTEFNGKKLLANVEGGGELNVGEDGYIDNATAGFGGVLQVGANNKQQMDLGIALNKEVKEVADKDIAGTGTATIKIDADSKVTSIKFVKHADPADASNPTAEEKNVEAKAELGGNGVLTITGGTGDDGKGTDMDIEDFKKLVAKHGVTIEGDATGNMKVDTIANFTGVEAKDVKVGISSGNLGVQVADDTSKGISFDYKDKTDDEIKDITNSNLTRLDSANKAVSKVRSKLGADQNRLEHTIKNLDNAAENIQASESRIRDVDMAKEMIENTKQNILQQASTAMLAQANMAPQSVLQLLG